MTSRTSRLLTVFILLVGVSLIFAQAYRVHRLPVALPEVVASYTLATGAGVDPTAFVDGGPKEGGIPPIDVPVFESVPSADSYLKDDGLGLAIERDGTEYFYPFQLLVWHEVINQESASGPLVVTYAPLAGVAAAFEASTTPGTRMTFVSSGKLWNNDTVLKDRETGSRWIQAAGESVDGPLKGTRLAPIPGAVMTWRAWKYDHPGGSVLDRETGAVRDYTEDPYGDYAASLDVYFPLTHIDPRLSAKTVVYGVARNGEARAYPFSAFAKKSSIIDAFEESSLSLTKGSDGIVLADDGTPLMRTYWFFWSALYPNTSVYGL